MTRLIKLFIVLLFFPSIGLPAPLVTGHSGTLTDGGELIISGSAFSAHSLSIEWLGGSAGNIEAGTTSNVFTKTNWLVDSDSTSFYAPRYSDAKSHSGANSIVSQCPDVSHYGSGFSYNYGSEFGEIYATWWVYFHHVDAAGQWKQWRLSPDSTWNNADGEIERGDFYTADGSCSQAVIMLFCDVDSYAQCYPDGNDQNRWTDCQPRGSWYRIELYAKESSSSGTRDGIYVYSVADQTNIVSTTEDWDGTIITRATGVSARWQYMQLQNFWGNISGGDGTNEKIYIDDIYIQIDDRAHVEIGDNAVYANCTHREIQIPTAWGTTEITVTLNQGSLNAIGGKYLFVIDADGTASAGYLLSDSGAQVTIGGIRTVTIGGTKTMTFH